MAVVAVVGLVFGVVGLVTAAQFKRGRGAGAARYYWDSTYPWYIRNVVFAAGPFGAGWLMVAGVGALFATKHPVLAMLGVVLILMFAVAFVTGVAWMRRPPPFLKPQWLLVEEKRRGRPPQSDGISGWIDRAFLALAVLIGACVLVGIPLLLAFEVAS